MYYKSYRIIDGIPTWVISDEDDNITKDLMIFLKDKRFFTIEDIKKWLKVGK